MSSNVGKVEVEDEGAQHPLVTYTNRLQKQFFIVTSLLYEQSVRPSQAKVPLLGVISNLPKEGREALKVEIKRLISPGSLSFADMNDLYIAIHDWAYEHLFKEAFAVAFPRSKTIAKIGS